MQQANNLALIPQLSIRPIQGWRQFLEAGTGYLRTATGAYLNGNRKFTPEILYNLVVMSIEKYVMAALMRHGSLPYNHTMADLVEALDEKFPHAIDDIREDLLRLDSYQDICDPYDFTIAPLAMDVIPGMLGAAIKLQQLVENELIGDSKS